MVALKYLSFCGGKGAKELSRCSKEAAFLNLLEKRSREFYYGRGPNRCFLLAILGSLCCQIYSQKGVIGPIWGNRAARYIMGDFPGGSIVKTLCFHSRGCGFDPRLGN